MWFRILPIVWNKSILYGPVQVIRVAKAAPLDITRYLIEIKKF